MIKWLFIAVFTYCLLPVLVISQPAVAKQTRLKVPILIGRDINPVVQIRIDVFEREATLQQINLQFPGTMLPGDVGDLKLFAVGADSNIFKPEQLTSTPLFAEVKNALKKNLQVKGSMVLHEGANYLWLSITPRPDADLALSLNVEVAAVVVNGNTINLNPGHYQHRLGIALRRHKQDGVHTHRIPGLATANNGTLLAIYDVRRNGAKDLQGNIDIGLSRSFDKGKTWQPLQVVMDMGAWGGLPEKFNGVSDANILVDKRTGTIYIAGLWMYGVLDEEGKWVEGLTESSNTWNHQWKAKGSQPGFDVKQTAQLLIVKSTDNGKTWSKPVNITRMCKQEDWWLWAPAPGQGITMNDGTLVFPTQGRDATGKPFSNITYSTDSGDTWKTSKPATNESTTENMAVELSDGTVMLNMRSNANSKDMSETNGRAIAVTNNLGKTWTIHPTSHNALPEPTCMASIIRHEYVQNGNRKSVLLFSNPNSKVARVNMTIKLSFDDGKTWPKEKQILLDEQKSRGYSCLTSIDEQTIGIVYESSQADLVFQSIKLNEIL